MLKAERVIFIENKLKSIIEFPLNEIKGNDNILKRTMIRVWIKKNG